MQIVINITAESIKNFFAIVGVLTIIFFLGAIVSKALRKIKRFKSKADKKQNGTRGT